jgi:hypothetical protein
MDRLYRVRRVTSSETTLKQPGDNREGRMGHGMTARHFVVAGGFKKNASGLPAQMGGNGTEYRQ